MATAEFIHLLTSHQSRLYSFILSLLFDPDQAEYVLQQTNTVLWQKASEFELGTNFVAWSFRVAHFQVLAQRTTLTRDRLVFDDELLHQVAGVATADDSVFLKRQRQLRLCLEQLSEPQRKLIRTRYSEGATLATVAEAVGKSIGAIKQSLFRVRSIVIDCVNAANSREAEA